MNLYTEICSVTLIVGLWPSSVTLIFNICYPNPGKNEIFNFLITLETYA